MGDRKENLLKEGIICKFFQSEFWTYSFLYD